MPSFGLLDVNNFYVNCELLFNPRLKGRCVVVLSNNDGCVVSRSPEAKLPPYNIKMGAPWFQLQTQFKPGEVIGLSSNYALYADMSDRVISVLGEYVPHYEQYSVDEAFLLFDGFNRDLTVYATALKNSVLKKTGLPVCVGLGPSKTLAKLANHCAKKRPVYDGVCNLLTLSEGEINTLLQSIPVADIWGIGSRIAGRLNAIGIHTAYDLKLAHRRTLRDRFSVTLVKTIAELNGEACLGLDEITPPKQTIASTRSFGYPVTSYQDLSESVTLYTSRAAEKARRQQSYANLLTVFIQTSPFANRPYYGNAKTVALPEPSHDTRFLVHTALWLLKRIYRPGHIYQKAGVILDGLVPAEGLQRDLFFDADNTEISKNARLNCVMDAINQRFGRQTLRLASQGFNAPWTMKQAFKTPRYTTHMDETIQV